MIITLLKHADRVKIACLAQLVNALSPIATVTGGPAWQQTTYYPFLHASVFGRGVALDLHVASPTYANPTFGEVPCLESIATFDEDAETLTIFAVNRSQHGPLLLDGDLRSLSNYHVIEHLVLAHDDPKAFNTAASPNGVAPHAGGDASMDGGRLAALLPKLSWNVIRLAARPEMST